MCGACSICAGRRARSCWPRCRSARSASSAAAIAGSGSSCRPRSCISSTGRAGGVLPPRRLEARIMADLRLEKLTKIYRPRGRAPVLAVDHVDLAVGDGEIVGLLGSSGCGKTSTLRMIAGFEGATEGRILCGGREIQDLPPSERDVAMAFKGYAL